MGNFVCGLGRPRSELDAWATPDKNLQASDNANSHLQPSEKEHSHQLKPLSAIHIPSEAYMKQPTAPAIFNESDIELQPPEQGQESEKSASLSRPLSSFGSAVHADDENSTSSTTNPSPEFTGSAGHHQENGEEPDPGQLYPSSENVHTDQFVVPSLTGPESTKEQGHEEKHAPVDHLSFLSGSVSFIGKSQEFVSLDNSNPCLDGSYPLPSLDQPLDVNKNEEFVGLSLSDQQVPERESHDPNPEGVEVDSPENYSFSFAHSAIHIRDDEETFITSIWATGLALRLGRIPTSFFVVVLHSDREWRTGNTGMSKDNDTVRWNVPIPIPSELSAIIRFRICGSPQSLSVLDREESLQELAISVEQLLSHSAKQLPFVLSPTSSLYVTITKWQPVFYWQRSTADRHDLLKNGVGDISEAPLGYQTKEDLDVKCTPNDYYPDYSVHTVTQSNTALAEAIICRVNLAGVPLDIPIIFYNRVLSTHPTGHPDRPSVLIFLAVLHLARFEKQQSSVDATRAEMLLHEAMGLACMDREKWAAISFMRLCRRHETAAVREHRSVSECCVQLLNATKEVQSALSQRHREKDKERISREEGQDIQRSVEQFELALMNCSSHHSCRASAQLNTTLAKVILYKVDHSVTSLDVPLELYQHALSSRPIGHPDRLSTLIHLAILHLAQFWKRQDNMNAKRAEALLREAADISDVDSHEKWAAISMLRLCPRRVVDSASPVVQPSMQRSSAPSVEDEDLMATGIQLMRRFHQFGDIGNLHQAIIHFQTLVESTPVSHPQYTERLMYLASGISLRFNRLGEIRDLDQGISMFRKAIENTSDAHPRKPEYLSLLSQSLFQRFKRLGKLGDLDGAISTLRSAVDLARSDHDSKPGYMSSLGNMLYTRFQRIGELSDVEGAISNLHGCVDLIPDDCRTKLPSLNILVACFIIRFDCLRELGDLECAISGLRKEVELTPNQNSDKPARLNCLGKLLKTRFELSGELNDFEQSISSLRSAIDLLQDGHSDKPAWLNDLGNSFLTRFERLGELGDLNEAIPRFRAAVELTCKGRDAKLSYLGDLGDAYFARYKRTRELSDLEGAVSTLGDAVDRAPHGDSVRPTCLYNFGNLLFVRFGRLGELSDLNRAISNLGDAISLACEDHPAKPLCLNVLANALRARFVHLGDINDLHRAISFQTTAADLIPDRHPDKLSCLGNLSSSFEVRFDRLGDLNDLEQAISRSKDAVNLTPDGQPNKADRLFHLAMLYHDRFQSLGELTDLEQVISRNRELADIIADNHPSKPACLNNLGMSFNARFQRLGDLDDLVRAISTLEDAIRLTPDDHADKSSRLCNLGSSLLTRFDRYGELGDLERAILMHEKAVGLCPESQPYKHTLLNSLGHSFNTRYNCLADVSDLERAISLFREAVNLAPDGHPQKSGHLGSFGQSLIARFDRIGDLADLEQATSSLREAVARIPSDHVDKPGLLSNLGNSYFTHFEHLGGLGDLDMAISAYGEAVDLMHDGHPEKPGLLSNHGNSLKARFERLREPDDIEQAISKHGFAVALIPNGHPAKPKSLNNLGGSLFARFEYLEEFSDLEQAVSNYEDALGLIPDGYLEKPECLSNLAYSLRTRFTRRQEATDINRAISIQGELVDLTADGDPHKAVYLDNLGSAFCVRFRSLGELSDIEQAISKYTDAVELTADDLPQKIDYLSNLALAFIERFNRVLQPNDFERAMSLFSYVASSPTGLAITRFRSSLNWIKCARHTKPNHHTLLHAYACAIGLLPQLAWTGLPLAQRYRELLRGADVVREAAAAALESGYPEMAVEWLEQGRSIIWGELFQLRSSHEDLSAAHPRHADRLRELSIALEQASVSREKSFTLNQDSRTVESPEQVARRHRKLAIERDELLREIRALPGFERFLLHKEFDQLRASAKSGPIIILNAAETRCDALIVLADVQNAIHVPLQNLTLEWSARLQGMLQGLVRGAQAMPVDERKGQRLPLEHSEGWESILAALWKCVAKPILDALALMAPGKMPRIFWCPTGPFTFFPIHAAGFYGTEHSDLGHKLFEFVVSSYVPTISVLASLPVPDPSSGDLCFIAVRQPATDGLFHLSGVDAELKHIMGVIGNSPFTQIDLRQSSAGTVEEVLELMKDADWVHFACHGMQDATNPTDSGLCLADQRRLKLTDIIGLSRPHGGLAFLSACQTAKGDAKLSDEALHIAAGMLFAGYGGVVGTMWSISDRLAPDVARDVYEQLFRTEERPDCREAARALQDAVGRLRNGGASFWEWLPFIHVGL